MGDVVFIAVLLAFFGLAVVFVRACDRIIGPETQTAGVSEPVERDEVAA